MVVHSDSHFKLTRCATSVSASIAKVVVHSDSSSSSSSSPLLSLVQVPAKLAINLSIHTQHTYDNGVDRTGDRVFRKIQLFT